MSTFSFSPRRRHSNAVRRWTLSLHKKRGQSEWTGPTILLACLTFTLTAHTYIRQIIFAELKPQPHQRKRP